MIPPKPKPRPERVSLWKYMKLFRRDILSAQPAKLYRAWMAEFKTPFFRSYLINDPTLVKQVLNTRPMDFPKSDRVGEGLRPLLGDSVFLTNGAVWERQRRIIDPAFEGGRVRETYAAMAAAADAGVARLQSKLSQGPIEIEEEASFIAADVIFRTLFSIPIEDEIATAVFHEFKRYQRSQPILNLAAFIPLPRWMPRGFGRDTRRSAQIIRDLIGRLTKKRMAEIKKGTAPDDLATKIMTTPDPETGAVFSTQEMIDQVAIFFLAGHETSASALAWGLYLLAESPSWQKTVATEAADFDGSFEQLKTLPQTRNVFREVLRLYPPVPMMVRSTTKVEHFRKRMVRRGSQIVLSPWHLHRHERIWDRPDAFDPNRWTTQNGKLGQRDAYIPFSSGRRVCTGASFAMIEGVLLLSRLVGAFEFGTQDCPKPEPVAHLTVRAKNGIWLKVKKR